MTNWYTTYRKFDKKSRTWTNKSLSEWGLEAAKYFARESPRTDRVHEINIHEGTTNGSAMIEPSATRSFSRYRYPARKKDSNVLTTNSPVIHWHDSTTVKSQGQITFTPNTINWYFSDGRYSQWDFYDSLRAQLLTYMPDTTALVREQSIGAVPVAYTLKSVHTFANASPQTCELWIYDMIARKDNLDGCSPSNLFDQFGDAFAKAADVKVGSWDNSEMLFNGIGASIQTAAAFMDQYKIKNTTHVVLQPGNQHQHVQSFRMNMVCNQARRVAGGQLDDPLCIGGYTHFIAVKFRGTLGHINIANSGFSVNDASWTGAKIDHWHEYWGVTGFSEERAMVLYLDLDEGIHAGPTRAQVTQMVENDPIEEVGN